MSGNHEKQMSAAERHEAAGTPARRARTSAWTVFWLTAGTSVLYNCYHALVGDHMPWYTGVPLGVLPLAVAIGVLEFSGAWRENKTLQVAAWSVTGGAMAWSAIAINAVVHHGWAFGLIGDTAALAAMYFLLNGPTAGQAVAKVARREADLLAEIAAGQFAREGAEAEIGRRDEAIRAAERARADAERAAATLRAGADESAGLRDALESVRADLASERAAREADRDEAARALDRAVRAARAEARKPRAHTGTARARDASGTQDDVANELRALMEFRDDPTLLGERQGGRLADKLGVHPSTGRRLHKRMVEEGELKPDFAAMAAPLAGGGGGRE